MSDIVKAEPPKSWVESFVARGLAGIKKAEPATPAAYVRETGSVLANYAGAGIVGGILGAAHARFGLDTRVGPLDGWAAAAGAFFAVALSGVAPSYAATAGRLGAYSFNTLTFRKSYELVKHEPFGGGGSFSGEVRRSAPGKGPGVSKHDRIEEVAKGLNL